MSPTKACNPKAISNLSIADRILFSKFGLGVTQTPPFQCVHHAFEAHAATQPNAIAVEHLEDSITYAELDHRANGIATKLRSLGVEPNSRVILLVERGILMVSGVLAILKAGGAYVPLDGTIVTQSTLDHVVKDSGCAVAVVLKKFAHRITDIPVICLEDIIPKPTDHCTKPEDLSSPTDSAYIIYTSGTTGKPKGVDVMHGNVTNLICLSPGNVGMRPGLRVSQLLNIAFDMAQWETLGSMANGCTLCVRGKSSKEWRALMKTVDIVIATPSMMGPHAPEDYPNIKAVAVAGEVCPTGKLNLEGP
jgi:non-ribosomal peptide synthetase component F